MRIYDLQLTFYGRPPEHPAKGPNNTQKGMSKEVLQCHYVIISSLKRKDTLLAVDRWSVMMVFRPHENMYTMPPEEF